MAMPKGTKFKQKTDDEVKAALEQARGILNTTAKILGVDRSSLEKRIKGNPELKKYQKDCIENTKDDIEGKLIKKAYDEEDQRAIEFYLKTQAIDRGYGSSMDLNLNTTMNVNINYDFDLNKLSIEEVELLYELRKKSLIEPDSESETETWKIEAETGDFETGETIPPREEVIEGIAKEI